MTALFLVNSHTIIAAGAVVLENTICEAGSIYAGVPAKKVKEIPQEMIAGEIHRIANNYVGMQIGSEESREFRVRSQEWNPELRAVS